MTVFSANVKITVDWMRYAGWERQTHGCAAFVTVLYVRHFGSAMKMAIFMRYNVRTRVNLNTPARAR